MIPFGEIEIDPIAVGSQGNAILGIRDSGKTYTAMALAERLMDAGIPIFAFDPVGVWRFLRVPRADGGRGYPVVVVSNRDGDLPLRVDSVPAVIEAAMKSKVSVVFDLFDVHLSKADWRRVVMAALKTLLHENHQYGLRHVFIEEAAEFAPQKVVDGHVYAEMEKLARMGGNARLGYTLINQRSEEVSKAVLELCDNLFLHRQKGRNSLTALQKWLDVGNVADGRQIVSTLSTLPTGQCWAWMQGSDTPTLVHVPEKNSMHPDRRVLAGDSSTTKAKAVDVGAFVKAMQKQLEKEAEPTAVPALKVDTVPKAQAEAERLKAVQAAEKRGHDAGLKIGVLRGRATMLGDLQKWVTEQLEAAGVAGFAGEDLHEDDVVQVRVAPKDPAQIIRRASPPPAYAPGDTMVLEATPRAAGPPPITSALAWVKAAASVHPVRMSWAQLGVVGGRKATGGSFNTAKKYAIEQGWLIEAGGLVTATAEGMDAAGVKPERGDPADIFQRALPEPAKRMFKGIRENPGITAVGLAALLQVQPRGGSWNTGMSMLKKNGLITMNGEQLHLADFRKGR